MLIEHNLDVIKNADYVIDLGPQGGLAGVSVLSADEQAAVGGNAAAFYGRGRG